jgi:hypothetical protein
MHNLVFRLLRGRDEQGRSRDRERLGVPIEVSNSSSRISFAMMLSAPCGPIVMGPTSSYCQRNARNMKRLTQKAITMLRGGDQ